LIVTGKRARRLQSWQGAVDERNRPIGHIEERDGRWHLIIGTRDVGSFLSRESARAFIAKLTGTDQRGVHG
jgi:hypothetical protein